MIGKLIALSKNGEEKGSLPVVNLHFFIGSDLFCDLRINHKDIAAQHCLITSQKNKPAVIRNLSRTVPTLVNNTEIGSSDVELKDNDIISIRHKNYKWCYNSSPTPSTSSHTSFVVSSKNRKSWPLFKNKLVAVVTPQRRDEQNETLPRKRRGTVAEENISKSKSTPKILAIKSGLRATTKQNLRKRKSSVKISPNTVSIERTPKVLPTLSRKSVKFLDVSGPRSRLGTRGRNSSNATPYKRTPKKKVSVYATPPSSLGRKKPIKSILKTPRSSSTTPRKDELNEQRLLSTSDILATPLPNVPEIIINSPSPAVNELLKTPEKGEQPEIVMRSSRRKAAIVRSPPSTPKSITKKRKSPEEKSIEASERAAKKLKQCPPHAIDKKKRAALLQCHRKSLTPHPVARRSGKLITSFPSSLSRRLEINSPIRSKFSSFPSISDSLKLPTDSLTPTVFKYTDSEMNLHNTTASLDKLKPVSRKKSNKSFSKETSPINRKFTRASRAARISNNLPQKAEATDVLSALDLSRRWPSPLQGEVSGNSSSNDVSNLSGFKKLFSADKTLDVRELFLEKNSESDILTGKSFQDLPETLSGRVSRQSAMSTEKSFQSLPETLSERVSRQSAILKGKQSTDIDEFMHSFQSEGAQDQPYSTSLLSGSLSSFPSYSSTSRRSLSLKRGRKSTLSPKDISGSNVEHRTEERRSSENIATQSSDIKILSPSVSRKGRRSLNILNGSSLENNQLMESSNSSNTNETTKNSVDKINVSSSLNEMPSKSFGDCKVNTKGSNDTSLDVSAFSLGSFNYSYHKSKSGDSLSLLQTSDVNAIDEETYLEDSMENGIAKDVLVKTPIASKAQSKGRISLRRAVLLASTPKPGKVLTNNESHLSLEIEVDSKEKIINKSGSYKLRMNRSHNTSADVSSVKLRKIMRKGKSFITKTSSRFASLPLTTDSSILKDLSPISTSVDDLRANRNRSLKNSKNLISNNKNNPVAASSSILSTNIFESVSTNHSHAEEVPELVSTLSSSANISLRKRDRTSKHDAELSQLEVSTNGKKRLRSIQLIVNEQNASKKNFSILEQSGTSRQSNKTANDSKLFVEVQKDKSTLSLVNKSIEEQSMDSELNISLANSQSSPLKKHSRSLPHLTENLHLRRSTRKGDASSSIKTSISVEESSATPIIKANSDSSIRRRGRSSKQSAGGGSSQMEISIVVKKRSPSLPSSFVDHVTPKQGLSILEASDKTRRSSGKGDDSVKLNQSNNNDSLFPSKLHDKIASAKKYSATPTVDTPSNTSIGRRGGPSQLSLSFVSSQTESSTLVKKRSRSLPSSSVEQVTPKQDLSILEDLSGTQRSSRRDTSKVLNSANTTPFLSASTLYVKIASGKKYSVTPTMDASSNTSIGRKGKPSKLSLTSDGPQMERSTLMKKRSRSLPSSSVDQITPKQDSSILEDISRTRRSSRRDTSKVLNNTNTTPFLSSSTVHEKITSGKKASATPANNESSNTSIGRKGKLSKLSLTSDSPQMERSTLMIKRSHCSPSSSVDQVTPKQDLSILENISRTRRSSRRDTSKVLNNTNTTPFSSSSTVHERTASGKKDSATPANNESSNTSIGMKGKPSKLSLSPDSPQMEGSTLIKKRSRSLPSSSVDQVTPKQDLSILEDISRTRRSSRRDTSKVLNNTNTTPFSSSSTVHEKTASGKKDSVTPANDESSNTSIGRKGKPSKLNLSPDSPQMERSTLIKKRSRSLPSSSVDQVTPKQDLSILEDISRTRRSSRRDTSKVLNNTNTIPFSSSSTVHEKTASGKKYSATPANDESSNTSIGRRGRPSEVSLSPDSPQMERSTLMKKRSRSLPSSSVDQITPKQDLSILEDISRTRRSSRRDTSKVLNNTNTAPFSSSSTVHEKTASGKKDSATPANDESSNTSIGRKGKPSKLNLSSDSPQMERSTLMKKRSRSLPSSSVDQVTPKQDLSILEDISKTRRSSRRDTSKVLNHVNTDNSSSTHRTGGDKTLRKTVIDSSSLTPSTLLVTTASEKEVGSTSTFNASPTTNVVRKSRSSKLGGSSDNLQLETATFIKKRSSSLRTSSNNHVTNIQDLSIIEDSMLTRRHSIKEDNSKILNKSLKNSSLLSPSTSPDKSSSGIEGSASPINEPSFSGGAGRRSRASKLNASYSDSSLVEKSIVAKKYSQSSPSDVLAISKQDLSILCGSSCTRRSSRKGDDGVVLNKTNTDASITSTASVKVKAISPLIKASSNAHSSVGRRDRSSKLIVSFDNLKLEKVIKKSSGSLPITSEVSSFVMDNKDHTRGGIRIGSASKTLKGTSSSSTSILNRTCSGAEVYATPNMSTLSSVSTKRSLPSSITSKDASAIIQNSRQITRKGDSGKISNKTSTRKSKKRKVDDVSPESDSTNRLFHGSGGDSVSPQAKKKVKFSAMDYSRMFDAFSSTPIHTKNPYLGSRSELKFMNSLMKLKKMQSPMGLSPIIGVNKNDSSANDKSSQVSMKCLRYSECPNDIGEGSKSDSLVSRPSKNKSNKVSRSHNSIDLGVTDSSNYGTNNSKVKLGKKKSTRISTSQNELPYSSQTQVTSEHLSEKEGKSLQLPSKARKSVTNSLQDSNKEKMINITSSVRRKTPIVKLTPGKSKIGSRRIKKKGKKSVEERNAVPVPESCEREAQNTEASILHYEFSSNLNRPSTDVKNVGESILSSPKTSELNNLTAKSPVPKRRGRPQKVKNISKNSANKISPVIQRQGRSAKNTNLTPIVKSAEASPQKMPKKMKGRKTIVAEVPSSSSKGKEIRNLKSATEQISEDVERKSSISFPKTRSKVAVLALKTSRKSIIITSPIVKSPSLDRARVGKVKSENIQSPNAKKQGQSAKKDSANVVSSSPAKRRGRSAINSSSNKREKLVTASPHLPKRGRLNKVQDNANEVIKESNTLPLKKRGRPAAKNDDSSTKRGNSKYDLSNNNETLVSPSLSKRRGRSAKVQESNLSVSGKRKDRKISESTEDANTNSRRGRSVVKNSDSNKKAKSEKDSVNNHETIASPSLPKKGRPTKVQDNNLSASGKGKDRKISENTEGTNNTLRRGRSVVKNSDSSHNKKAKSEKDLENKVQETTDSRKKTKKNSDVEEVQTNMRRGRSAVKGQLSSPGKKTRLITQESAEGDANLSIDSPSPKRRGRPAKRITRKTFEKPTDNQSTLPLQKRVRSAVKNSDSSPVKRGKSNKDPIDTNAAVSSPPVPKRGRHAKIQDVTVSMKDASNNKDLDQNLSSKQRRGRSRAAGVGKNSPDRKVEAKQEIKKNIVNQIPSTSSSKNGRPVVLENVSPRKSRSVTLKKKTSPVNKKQVTDNPLKMAGRRAKVASSPQPEVRKVSERSKAIKKSSKSKDMKPLKSAIKKRLSRKSSLMGPAFINHGRRKVHFNKYVARNSNSKKK